MKKLYLFLLVFLLVNVYISCFDQGSGNVIYSEIESENMAHEPKQHIWPDSAAVVTAAEEI